jgi:hypothetical protein
MAEATPSAATRRLIRSATTQGRTTTRAVLAFATAARQAVRAFDAEVNPLDLSDDDYELVSRASGLAFLFDLVEGMRETLAGVTAA